MNTLKDIDGLLNAPYGLRYAIGVFAAEKTVHFCGSEREWKSVLESCDAILRKHHGIIPKEKSEGSRPNLILPFAMHFRDAFFDTLSKRPDTIEECNEKLRDVLISLETLQSLHDITPYAAGDAESSTLRNIRCATSDPALTRHMIDVEEESIACWNFRRARQQQEPLFVAWTDTQMQSVFKRPEVTSRYLFYKNSGRPIAHYVTRPAMDGRMGYDIIDFAAIAQPGVADRLAVYLVHALTGESRKRIHNLIPQSHATVSVEGK